MITQKRPDIKKALSLIESAKRDITYTLSLSISPESANILIRNIYESFRMLGEAILTAKGIQSEDHVLPISELTIMKIQTKRPLNLLDNLRKLRRNINYYGYSATKEEAEDIVNFARVCFDDVFKEAKKIILRAESAQAL
jgi:uncharacterized protein (UPF0332 family)